MIDPPSPHISPVARNLAKERFAWTQLWSENHGRSHGWNEEQVQAYINQPEPGQAMQYMQIALKSTRSNGNYYLFDSVTSSACFAGLVKYAG